MPGGTRTNPLAHSNEMLPIPEYVIKACEASEAAFYAFARASKEEFVFDAAAEQDAERAAVRRDVAIRSFVAVSISKDRRSR